MSKCQASARPYFMVATSTADSSTKSAVRRKIPTLSSSKPNRCQGGRRLCCYAGSRSTGCSYRRDCVPCSWPEDCPARSIETQEQCLAPASPCKLHEIFVARHSPVYWLVQHFRSGVRAMNSSFAYRRLAPGSKSSYCNPFLFTGQRYDVFFLIICFGSG